MATRVSDSAHRMRKQPRQARSRDTVAVIIEAGAQVLACKGWSGFNTNDVAAAAGVSIGSIYQYFPNKLALVEAIKFSHFDEVLSIFDTSVEENGGLENQVHKLIDGMIGCHHHPGLHRVLMNEVPRPDNESPNVQHFDLAYKERFRNFVAMTTGLTDMSSLDLIASVVASAVEGMVHEAAQTNDDSQQRRFRDEIVQFIVSYLERKNSSVPT